MTSLTILIILVPIIALALVLINYILATYNPMPAKLGVVECGIITLVNQSRQPFSIIFIVVAVLFLAFDLEVVLLWPLSVVLSTTGLYGFWVAVLFFAVLTVGFVVELASGALNFESP